MSIGIVGRKAGMTRVFTEDGVSQPVTVIVVEPNRVTLVRTQDADGYEGYQVTTGEVKASRLSKAEAGHFAKTGAGAGRGLWEFRLGAEEFEKYGVSAGAELTASIFEAGQKIDVTGTSKGKGFQGGVKRHNFAMQDATHGNSLSHRAPGSIGQNQTPGRVFKGKKMAGHMGDARTTVQNLEVVRVDVERNLLLVRGAVPGAKSGDVFVSPSIKARGV